jgi:nucleotide-binding universal stress UspA family protein
VIRETARARAARLIVMTTHGRGGASPWVLGSVAEQVLRRGHLPVLFLSPQALAAGDARRLRERLVVSTDGSAVSERIFPTAQRLARCLWAPVTFVRVVDPGAYYRSAAIMPYGSLVPPTFVDDVVTAERATLEAEGARWRGQDIAANVRVPTGSPSETIVAVAGECQAGWRWRATDGRGSAALSAAVRPAVSSTAPASQCWSPPATSPLRSARQQPANDGAFRHRVPRCCSSDGGHSSRLTRMICSGRE